MRHLNSSGSSRRARKLEHFVLSLASILVASAAPGPASAVPGRAADPDPELELGAPPAPPSRKEAERWVPSVSIVGGFIGQQAAGGLVSGPVLGPSLPNPTQPIRPSAGGSDFMVSVLLGGSFELMTPRLFASGGQPRIFGHIDPLAAIGFKRSIAGESKPGSMNYEPGNALNPGEEVVTGQGSRLFAKTQPFVLSAGAGIAFTVELWERTVRIKPSIEYVREEIKVTGQVHRAVQIVNPASSNADFRFIQLNDTATKAYHGLGPGLEVEGDAARTGPFVMSVYLSGQAYRFLGDLGVDLIDTNEFGETAVWNFDKGGWGGGARVGLRFRWLPK